MSETLSAVRAVTLSVSESSRALLFSLLFFFLSFLLLLSSGSVEEDEEDGDEPPPPPPLETKTGAVLDFTLTLCLEPLEAFSLESALSEGPAPDG